MADTTFPEPHIDSRVNTRLTALLFVFVLWGTLVLLRLGQLMIVEHDRTLAELDKAALTTGIVPALRGRLLDRDGRVLAWSERRFRVRWTPPTDPEDAARELALFEELPTGSAPCPSFPDDTSPGIEQLVAADLNPEQAARWSAAVDVLSSLKITGYSCRRRVRDPQVRARLGRVARRHDGMTVGLNGAEKTHDRALRGTPGMFRVMIDKHGDWIPETWSPLREARPGFDVHLPIRTDSPGDP